MKVAGGMAALILVLAIIMFAVVRRVDPVHEGFLNTPAIAAIAAVTSASINEYEKLVTLLIMEEVRNFYKNTIDISMILKNIRLYSELNYNSGKERNYFENNQYMLNKSVTDARNAQRLFDRKTKLSTALIKVTLQLIVIIAFVMLGIMAVQDVFPGMRPVIYTIGGLMKSIAATLAGGKTKKRTGGFNNSQYTLPLLCLPFQLNNNKNKWPPPWLMSRMVPGWSRLKMIGCAWRTWSRRATSLTLNIFASMGTRGRLTV